jgi:hypothetical protein
MTLTEDGRRHEGVFIWAGALPYLHVKNQLIICSHDHGISRDLAVSGDWSGVHDCTSLSHGKPDHVKKILNHKVIHNATII